MRFGKDEKSGSGKGFGVWKLLGWEVYGSNFYDFVEITVEGRGEVGLRLLGKEFHLVQGRDLIFSPHYKLHMIELRKIPPLGRKVYWTITSFEFLVSV